MNWDSGIVRQHRDAKGRERRTGTFVTGTTAKIALLALSAVLQPTAEAQNAARPSPLPAETSDIAEMPAAGPHRVFVSAGLGGGGGANVLDVAEDGVKLLGMVPINQTGVMALSRDGTRVYVLETFYQRGNRGPREDVLAVYDARSLKLLKEIVVPGRALIVPRTQLFDVSEDGRLAYIYDFLPASSVHVVDLEQGKVTTSVDLPGCALVFPFGARGFGSVCGDGTLSSVEVPTSGVAKASFTKPFFSADEDPLFETSVIDRASGEAWFLSYSGKVFPVKFGPGVPRVDKSWSLTAAAGMAASGTGLQELAWRPGGSAQVIAVHRPSKRLYVLMHTGTFWTHKHAGSEVWVFDTAKQALLRRIKLERPAVGIAVSQDETPLLYVAGEGPGPDAGFSVLDAQSGEPRGGRGVPALLSFVSGT